jgi:hypothetical protein
LEEFQMDGKKVLCKSRKAILVVVGLYVSGMHQERVIQIGMSSGILVEVVMGPIHIGKFHLG